MRIGETDGRGRRGETKGYLLRELGNEQYEREVVHAERRIEQLVRVNEKNNISRCVFYYLRMAL